MRQVVPLRYGTIFKKAFGDVEVFKGFVKAVLDIDMQIDRVETEKSFYPPVSPIDVSYDIFAEDTTNRIIVEIQHQYSFDHWDRFLYYHSAAFVQMKRSSKDYRPLQTLYTIVVQTSANPQQEDIVTIDLDGYGRKRGKLGILQHKIIFLCSKHIQEDTPLAVRQVLAAIEDSLDKEVDEAHFAEPAWLQKALTLIEEDGLTPKERARLIEDNHQEEDRDKAREEGEAKGEARGEAKGMLKAALNMMSKGIALEQAAELAGIPLDSLQAAVATR